MVHFKQPELFKCHDIFDSYILFFPDGVTELFCMRFLQKVRAFVIFTEKVFIVG